MLRGFEGCDDTIDGRRWDVREGENADLVFEDWGRVWEGGDGVFKGWGRKMRRDERRGWTRWWMGVEEGRKGGMGK